MKFLAELKQVRMNKLASLDKQMTIVLTTDDPLVKDLMDYKSDDLMAVEIRGENETGE